MRRSVFGMWTAASAPSARPWRNAPSYVGSCAPNRPLSGPDVCCVLSRRRTRFVARVPSPAEGPGILAVGDRRHDVLGERAGASPAPGPGASPPILVLRYAMARFDAPLSTPAARMPSTAYAVSVTSGLPKFLRKPPFARIWLASHCAPRWAPRWAFCALVSAPTVPTETPTNATLNTEVMTSARSPRRALDMGSHVGGPFAGGARNTPARLLPIRRPLRSLHNGRDRTGPARAPSRLPRRFIWSPPRRVFRLVPPSSCSG